MCVGELNGALISLGFGWFFGKAFNSSKCNIIYVWILSNLKQKQKLWIKIN